MRLLLEDDDTRCNHDNQSEALAKVDDDEAEAVVDLVVVCLVVFCLAWLFVAGLVDGWFEFLFGGCCCCCCCCWFSTVVALLSSSSSSSLLSFARGMAVVVVLVLTENVEIPSCSSSCFTDDCDATSLESAMMIQTQRRFENCLFQTTTDSTSIRRKGNFFGGVVVHTRPPNRLGSLPASISAVVSLLLRRSFAFSCVEWTVPNGRKRRRMHSTKEPQKMRDLVGEIYLPPSRGENLVAQKKESDRTVRRQIPHGSTL